VVVPFTDLGSATVIGVVDGHDGAEE